MLGYQVVRFTGFIVMAGLVLILDSRTGCAAGPKDGGTAPLKQASGGVPHQQLPRGKKKRLSSILKRVKYHVPQTLRTPS